MSKKDHAQALRSRLRKQKRTQTAPFAQADRSHSHVQFEDGTKMPSRCFFELAAAAIHRGEFDDDTDDEFIARFLGPKPAGL